MQQWTIESTAHASLSESIFLPQMKTTIKPGWLAYGNWQLAIGNFSWQLLFTFDIRYYLCHLINYSISKGH